MRNKLLVIALLLAFTKIFIILGWGEMKPPAGAEAQDTDFSLSADLMKDPTFLMALKKRQSELDEKELALKREEDRLATLRNELIAKIETLRSLEGELAATLEAEKGEAGKRLKDLARVYEAMPPEKAAVTLAKLDVKTAAGITINMKKERAGAIWGYLDPRKAEEITREITRQRGEIIAPSPTVTNEPVRQKVPPTRKKLPAAARQKKTPAL